MPSGEVVRSQRVELLNTSGEVVGSVLTTQEGNFRFNAVEGGDYKLRARNSKYGEVETEVEADDSLDNELQF